MECVPDLNSPICISETMIMFDRFFFSRRIVIDVSVKEETPNCQGRPMCCWSILEVHILLAE